VYLAKEDSKDITQQLNWSVMKKSSCFILLLALSLLFLNTAALAEMVAVNRNNVSMLSKPNKKGKVLWRLDQGFPLKVQKRSGKWLHVRDFEGASGWVHASVAGKQGHMIVKKKTINLRSRPHTRSNIVAKANYGVVFRTLEKKKGWVKVRQGGVTGWVNDDLLWGF
jgi:SH3-like domain-containing protein